MRVIAGKARSLRLKSIEGMDTRPTTDRIKETLFNMINDDLYGASFLDLFSGSGGIGIEALSRGAQESRFCGEQPEGSRLHPGKSEVHPAGLRTGRFLSWTFSGRWIPLAVPGRELFC